MFIVRFAPFFRERHSYKEITGSLPIMTFYLKNFLAVVVFMLSQTVVAASQSPASLENRLETLTGQARIPVLIELAKHYVDADPEKASTLAQETRQLLDRYPNTSQSLLINHHLATAYFNLGETEQAAALVIENEKLAQVKGNLDEKATAAKDIAYSIMNKDGNYLKAIEYFQQALKDYRELEHSYGIGLTLGDIGLMYYYNGNYEQALAYYNQALEQSGYLKKLEATRTYSDIAQVYMHYGRYHEAIPHYNQALAHARRFEQPSWVAEQLLSAGVAYLMDKNNDKAIAYLNEALVLAENADDKHKLFFINKRLGEAYRSEEEYSRALEYHNRALVAATDMDSKALIIQSQIDLGIIYSWLEQYETSMDYYQQALTMAVEVDHLDMKIEAHKNVSELYKQLNNHEKAYEHLAEHHKFKAQQTAQAHQEQVSGLSDTFKTEQIVNEFKLLTHQEELAQLKFQHQRNYLLAGFIALALLVAFFFYRQNQQRRLVGERALMMSDLVERKNQLLADVSHELRTPLTVLQLKVEALQHNLVKDVPASYDGLIVKIREINRLISDIYQVAQSDIGALKLDLAEHNCLATLTSWTEELAETVTAKGFKWSQSIDIADDVDICFDKDKVKQVICNLVDNSMTYTDLPGQIVFDTRVRKDQLDIRIQDSAPGVRQHELPLIFERLYRVETSRSRATGGSGLGLSICKSIIEAHRGTIMSSDSHYKGLAITIHLPLSQAE
ncbi:tetratricopeptide repeat protein [Thalassomonas viridans]|uniref:histidine kinase n=1 Tax=Thalassomonas viridans TaxID=137584 RepID=A0AAF0CB13_9GAMM|nr:tetratricopeptide repeat protein [Thalassomonas viridans]WDE07111.1 tetratricopeptide repeat protein [Thalassomonas viridans]